VTSEWEAYKFFASLPSALKKVADLKVRKSEATTLEQLRNDIEAARQDICSVWNTEVIKAI
jgi:hypothetical protein